MPYAERRQRLAALIGDHALALVFANAPALRNGDVDYPFRQHSDFYYLTGLTEPQAALVVLGGTGESILFNRPPDADAEQWTGARLGQAAAPAQLGVQAAYPIQDLSQQLPTLMQHKACLYYLKTQDAQAHALLFAPSAARAAEPGPNQWHDLNPLLSELRLLKDDTEIATLKKAVSISVQAHHAMMRACKQARYEYHLDALWRYHVMHQGCDQVAYPSIVAGGKNACILHYTANSAPLVSGELVLVDAGAEYHHYAADITRTFPVNGRFSGEQRALYELVLLAQQTAIASIKPLVPWSQLQETIVKILTSGLRDLGILKGDLSNLIENKAYKPFYMHQSGHWLGLDVHDKGSYKLNQTPRPLAPHMVLTVEPGLYIPAHCPQVEARWRGIGIRIEDDILVTAKGHQNLSHALPVSIADIEALIKEG